MIDHQGGRGAVESFFVERDSPWREILRGESLHRENSRGEKVFGERISLWRDFPRRDSL
jgi:hypothetical protein